MGMNAPGIGLNERRAEFGRFLHTSRQGLVNAPIMSLPTWLSLLGYLLVLAITQTVYSPFFIFMNLRWVMLAALVATSAGDWIVHGARRGYRTHGKIEQLLMIYLLATFGTVIYAQNWVFSGMRWASHAAMLVIFLLFLPQLMVPRQARRMLDVLKGIMAALLIYSFLRPFIEGIPDTGTLYHGAMGNANTMGHIAFMAALLFLHQVLISKSLWVRRLSGALVIAAAVTVWETGARSSILALVIGVVMLFHFYPRETQGLVMAGILLGGLAMVSFPSLPDQVSQFVLKKANEENHVSSSLDALRSRRPVWTAAWDGFKERPLVGWGFGADRKMTEGWEVKLTAIGAVERDAVNDFLFMMEGCGIIGLCSYLLLILIVLKQRPSSRQRSILQRFSRNHDVDPGTMDLHHAHVVLFILPTCLLFLNQFDNSALSAGNLISVITWLSTASAAILREEIN
jgi:O-antigen ligase